MPGVGSMSHNPSQFTASAFGSDYKVKMNISVTEHKENKKRTQRVSEEGHRRHRPEPHLNFNEILLRR